MRVLPFGIIMRDLEERGASMDVRLSPVELANLHLINDPALGNEHGDESGDVPVTHGALAPRVTGTSPDSSSSTLGREEADVIQVGPQIDRIAQGQDGPVAFERVEVHPDNPHFMTDGRAVYTKDGTELVRLVVPSEEYQVAAGCERIGDRAFDSQTTLTRITLPASVRSIGRLAFAKTGISFLDLPEGLRFLEEKACFECRSLKAVILPESLESIGGEAFANSGLERVRIPAKVKAWGLLTFAGTPAERQAHQGAITLDPQNETYVLDKEGGLYQGDVLVELLSCVRTYEVRNGCAAIGDEALRRDLFIRQITLPEGVKRIGKGAFQGCRNLAEVNLPESLLWIGDKAFVDTAVSALRLSASVEHIGEEALLTQGSSPARRPHLLRRLELDANNERFYIESGLLCERGVGYEGGDKAITYVGPDTVVRIPEAVNQLAPYAFFDAVEVDELTIHGHMQSIARGSLGFARAPRILKVAGERDNGDVAFGDESGDVPVTHGALAPQVTGTSPDSSPKATSPLSRSFSLPSLTSRYRDITDLFATVEGKTVFRYAYFDAWVTHCGNTEEFAKAAVERLQDPVNLDPDTYEVYASIFHRKEQQICACCARRGDLAALEFLLEEGLISAAAISAALEEATVQQDAQATACLLEASHRRGAPKGLDLSL